MRRLGMVCISTRKQTPSGKPVGFPIWLLCKLLDLTDPDLQGTASVGIYTLLRPGILC